MSRMRLALFLFLTVHCIAADPQPYLKSAPMPFYPPLCRQARISGTVTLNFTVDENGATSEVEATGGHQLLRDTAAENVKNWKYGWTSPCSCRVKKEVVFVYSFGGWLDDDGPSSIVKWFGKAPVTRVEVQAGMIFVQPWMN